jgi:gas vesicle protein
MSTSKLALGICGALAAGVVIGLLLAPEKGSDMRKRLKKTAGEWVDHLGNVFTHVEDEVEEVKQKARNIKTAATE